MGLIKEPLNIDLNIQSTPWTEAELSDFRLLMQQLKAKKLAKKLVKQNLVAA